MKLLAYMDAVILVFLFIFILKLEALHGLLLEIRELFYGWVKEK